MGFSTIAFKLADEFSTSLDDAQRFVDEIGETNAKKLLNDSGSGDSSLGTWDKRVLGGGAITGGSFVTYEAAKGWQADSRARRAKNRRLTIADLMDNKDMSPKQKRKLVSMYLKDRPTNNRGNRNGGSGGLLSNLLGGDIKTILALVVVLAVVTSVAGGQ